MNETDWLTSTDPAAMLRWLIEGGPTLHEGYSSWPSGSRVNNRKLRLFAVACCRQVWDGVECRQCNGLGNNPGGPDLRTRIDCLHCHGTGWIGGLTDPRSQVAVEVAERLVIGLLTDPRSRAAVEVAERFADGEATEKELAISGYGWVGLRDVHMAVEGVMKNIFVPPATQAALLRDIFGNPFRPPPYKRARHYNRPWVEEPKTLYRLVSRRMVPQKLGVPYPDEEWLAVDWLTWQDSTVPKLAAQIYVEREWSSLPILADALEEAGCVDEDILGHLRGPAPHARGCWVVDLLLGKG